MMIMRFPFNIYKNDILAGSGYFDSNANWYAYTNGIYGRLEPGEYKVVPTGDVKLIVLEEDEA